MKRVALVAGLLTVAFGFARDAVYVEKFAVKASCMIWPSFCGPKCSTLAYEPSPAQAAGSTTRSRRAAADGRGHQRAADGAHVVRRSA